METETPRPLCQVCNKNKAMKNYKVAGTYQKKCSTCSRGYANRAARDNRARKMEGCTKCGFIPEHSCQMDIDHIDGDHTNNSPENLQVLCANCHRLKTYVNREIRLGHR